MDRTGNFLKSTIINYIFRLIGILLGFFTIPVTLEYLGDERFGIWQTILSMISWAALANFGIGNGLRNIISSEYNDNEKINSNISSAYYFVSKISIVIMIILLLLICFFDASIVFKNTSISIKEIKISFIIIALNFCINFILGLCTSIAYGLHKSYYVTIQQTIISLVTLILISIIGNYLEANIIYIAILYTIINIISNIILSIIIFKSGKQYIPKIIYNKKKVDNKMYKLGIQFFFVQIGSLILASTDNFLVSTLISVEDVTYYSIVNKLFLTINTIYSILLVALWNSTTDAFSKSDYKWIKKAIKNLLYLLIPIAIVLLICCIMFDKIIYIWVGRTLNIENSLIWLTAIYVLILCFNSIFINIQNGIGKINSQIIAVIIAGIINIPCAFLFVRKLRIGMSGVVLANIFSQLIICIICPLDVVQYINKCSRKR